MSASQQLINAIKKLGTLDVNSETAAQRIKLEEFILTKISLIKQNIELSLSANIEVNEEDTLDGKDKDDNGQHLTALMWATRYGLTNIAQHLVKHGANIKATDKHGKSVLHHAALYGQLEIIKILNGMMPTDLQQLLECPDKNMGCTPLLLAAAKGHPNVVSYLIEQKANPDAVATTENGRKLELPILPLMAARGLVQQNYPSECKFDSEAQHQILQILKKTGINFNRPTLIEKGNPIATIKKYSSLSIAANECAVVIAQAMLEAGADQNAKNSDGYECLPYVVGETSPLNHPWSMKYSPAVTEIEKLAMLELLLQYQPSQESIDNGLQTLRYRGGRANKLSLSLLEHGADLKKVFKDSSNHLYLAHMVDTTTFCQILTMQKSAQPIITQELANAMLKDYARYHQVEYVKAIFEAKRVDARTKDSNGLLMVDVALCEALSNQDMCEFSDVEANLKRSATLIHFLIEQGASANAVVRERTNLGRAVFEDLREKSPFNSSMPRLSQC